MKGFQINETGGIVHSQGYNAAGFLKFYPLKSSSNNLLYQRSKIQILLIRTPQCRNHTGQYSCESARHPRTSYQGRRESRLCSGIFLFAFFNFHAVKFFKAYKTFFALIGSKSKYGAAGCSSIESIKFLIED
jgi:hypothetical protein